MLVRRSDGPLILPGEVCDECDAGYWIQYIEEIGYFAECECCEGLMLFILG